MIVRCPECKREYNLELDVNVVEMTFTCPNCKTAFKVRNLENSEVQNVTETDSAEKKESSWVVNLLKVLLALAIVLLLAGVVVKVVYNGLQEEEGMIDTEVVSPAPLEEDAAAPVQETKPAPAQKVMSAPRQTNSLSEWCYEAGFKVGYTGGPEYKEYGRQDEWCRDLWGIIADYDMLNNEALYQQFKKGFYAGMDKRTQQMQKDEQERYELTGFY